MSGAQNVRLIRGSTGGFLGTGAQKGRGPGGAGPRARALGQNLVVIVVGIDASELLWTRLYHLVIESGLYRGLSLPFAAAIVVWAAAAAMIVIGHRAAVGTRLAGQPGVTSRDRRGDCGRRHPHLDTRPGW